MASAMKRLFMVLTVLLMSCSIYSYEYEHVEKRSVNRRQRQRLRNRFEALQRQQLSGNLEWSRMFVPEVPTADEVDCNIEVEVTEVIGGRCVRLGGAGRLAVCQSGMYLDVHNEACESILSNREMISQSPHEASLYSQDSQSQSTNNAAEQGAVDTRAGEDTVTDQSQASLDNL